MKITKIVNGEELEVALDGRLDTITAVELETFLNENLGDAKTLILDCACLTYISSAGLRVLLSTQKKFKDGLKLTNVQELVMEVFDITGFSDILTIE